MGGGIELKDINLLVEEDKLRQVDESNEKAEKKKGSKVKAVMAVVAALLIVVFTIALPVMYSQTLKARLSSIQKELEREKYIEIKTLNKQLEASTQAINDKQAVIDTIDREHYSVSEILDILKNAVPQGCTIKDVKFAARTVNVTLVANNPAQIAEFLLDTGRLEYINLTDLSNSVKIGGGNEYSFTFDIAGGEGSENVNG